MSSNPFTIIFGIEPQSMIPRRNEYLQIITVFESKSPMTLGYVLTGVRGSGKTVLMTSVQNRFEKDEGWYVLRLNPDMDLYASAVSQLGEHVSLKSEQLTGVNFSAAGFGAGVNIKSFSTNETLLRKMLREAKDQKKRVLITIDEASNTESIRTFAHSYQAFIGEGLPVFLLMTSLPENFNSLSNSKNATFLRRLPRISLEGLNDILIEDKYREIFNITENEAAALSRIVMGYPYAFQLLGALLWDDGKKSADESILHQLDIMLSEGAYLPIWEHLSPKEQLVLRAVAHSSEGKVKEIRSALGMEPNQFSPYRESLKMLGLIDTSTYGKIAFSLPRFLEFVIQREKYMMM